MTKPRPKKHHYVPQIHLRQFTGSKPPGMVWTYDKQGNEPRASLPKETGAESNLYSVRGRNGQYDDDIELWLSGIESRAKVGYEQLLQGEIPSGSERVNFATFLASLHVRTPAQLRKVGESIGKADSGSDRRGALSGRL